MISFIDLLRSVLLRTAHHSQAGKHLIALLGLDNQARSLTRRVLGRLTR
jgi:hypothetical protein